jgi:hypothetical protein
VDSIEPELPVAEVDVGTYAVQRVNVHQCLWRDQRPATEDHHAPDTFIDGHVSMTQLRQQRG